MEQYLDTSGDSSAALAPQFVGRYLSLFPGTACLFLGTCFPFNGWIRSVLDRRDLIAPLEETVGSMSQPLTFVVTFAFVLAVLAAT